jgi:hypothetical protein
MLFANEVVWRGIRKKLSDDEKQESEEGKG